MHKSPPGTLSYNSLLDEHLAEFYSSPQRRRHLRRMGLITRDGRLVDERTFQRRAVHKEYRERYRDEIEAGATATVGEKQRQQKAELKKKLEALAKYETVQRIKREKVHPPGIQTWHPGKGHFTLGQSSLVPGQTAPVPKTSPAPNALSNTHLSRAIERHKDRVTFSPEELGELKHLVETISGAKIATPTVIQTKAVPHPLGTSRPRTPAASKNKSGHSACRRPSTAPSKPRKQRAVEKTGESVEGDNGVRVTLTYLGTTKALKKKMPLTEVEVQQQARGHTPVSVYKDYLRAGEMFSFRSIRYPGMPFALVIYASGMIDCRVSVCCEHRHRPGTPLGGPSARFKVASIEGGSPCHLCQRAREEKKAQQKQKLELHAQSALQLSQTHSGTQGEGEGENSRSHSPTSSLYSASFLSESPEPSDDEDGDRRGGSIDSPHSLPESKHSVISNKAQGDAPDSEATTNIDPVPAVAVEEPHTLKEIGVSAEAFPDLVTRAGVRIVYQLGPVSTSESGTQTDEQATPETESIGALIDDSHLVTTPPRTSTDEREDKQPKESKGGASELDSISRSSLTQVSGRSTPASTTTPDSRSPSPSLPASGSPDNRGKTKGGESNKQEATACEISESQPHTTEGHQVICEEEFSKAWT